MVDIIALDNAIKESGMTITTLTDRAGMVRQVFYHRMNGIGEFTASEIKGLTKALRLTNAQRDSIFFKD